MKRLMALLLAGVLLVPALCGCTQKKYEPYTVLEAGSEELKAVYTYANEEDYTAPEQMTVKVNGKKYTGAFDDKYGSGNDVMLVYEGEDCRFTVSAVSGELLHFFRRGLPKTTKEISNKEARKIADSIAGDYIYIRDYEITVDKSSNRFTYTRYISGYPTTEELEINLREDGELESIELNDIGMFGRVESVNIDQDELDDALDRKLNELAERDAPEDEPDIEIKSSSYQRLLLLENGQIAYYGEHIISTKTWHDHYFLYVIVEHQKKVTPTVEFN